MCSYVTCIWARRLGQKVAGGGGQRSWMARVTCIASKTAYFGAFPIEAV